MQQVHPDIQTRPIAPSQSFFKIKKNAGIDDLTPRKDEQDYEKRCANKEAETRKRRRRRQILHSIFCCIVVVLTIALSGLIPYLIILRSN